MQKGGRVVGQNLFLCVLGSPPPMMAYKCIVLYIIFYFSPMFKGITINLVFFPEWDLDVGRGNVILNK